MPTLAIVTAAGSGTRLGMDLPKALVPLGGQPLLVHAVRRVAASGVVDAIVVTAPAGLEQDISDLLADVVPDAAVLVVAGGATRQASVAAGLALAPPDVDVVLVHDAARPLAPPELIRRVARAVRRGHPAVVPGVAVADTLKRVGLRPGPGIDDAPGDSPDSGDGPGIDDAPGAGGEPVVETVDRGPLRAVQTPQGFDRAVLDRAHAAAAHRAADETTAATDDAGLVEAIGEPVLVVAGDPRAAKITTAHDLRVAGVFLEEES